MLSILSVNRLFLFRGTIDVEVQENQDIREDVLRPLESDDRRVGDI